MLFWYYHESKQKGRSRKGAAFLLPGERRDHAIGLAREPVDARAAPARGPRLRKPLQALRVVRRLPAVEHRYVLDAAHGLHSSATARRGRAACPTCTPSCRRAGRTAPCRCCRRGCAPSRPGSLRCIGQAKTQRFTGYPANLLEFGKDAGGHHPTQKPVALMEYLARTYTDVGDTVLDNCMGSGSTGVACVNAGRPFVGIEKDACYYETARNGTGRRRRDARTGWSNDGRPARRGDARCLGRARTAGGYTTAATGAPPLPRRGGGRARRTGGAAPRSGSARETP